MIGPVDVTDAPYYTSPAAGRHFARNLWPERPQGLRPVYERYYRVMDALAIDLMRLFALALGLPERYFDSSVDRSISRLRVRNYPAPAEAPKPGQLRAGAHSDYGSLTILKTEDRLGGLQVLGKDGAWLDVPHLPGCFVVNIGDMLARWTNDRWVSTLHRVVSPRPIAGPEAVGSRWCSSRTPTTTPWCPACRAAPKPAIRRNIRRPPPAAICARSS